MSQAKIATCCYCGTRATLVLAGRTRHELACRSCGAPLTKLKMLPVRDDAAPVRRSVSSPQVARPVQPAHPVRPKKRKAPKRAKKLFGEVWDLIEDIFD
ncbi:hypothetical protein [Wenxinia marina]|uniref:Uncharacterized protein n=1 Tax=Wenxinia marina DSM 24838 TaxID=1123501 RepID=A0A0D0QDG7_9RHOB|nr:hypothetical protein [Wenxinia marina]KIQ69043.1 hypothetical protein Wenmar_02111 [Wenxinia marina DSM 24838]GGL69902.1 hypothetical protein GCM10011392_25520 [Wenxinia marina]